MPEIGEVKRGIELGKSTTGYTKYVWVECPECKKGRWVRWRKQAPVSTYCLSCKATLRWRNKAFYVEILEKRKGTYLRGDKNPAWKGGKSETANGYIRIKLQPNNFFYPMAGNDSYVLEHRLVMAKYVGRCLLPWEVVHHKGTKYPIGSKEDKADNRIENLELIKGRSNHAAFNLLQKENKALKKRIEDLEAKLRRK